MAHLTASIVEGDWKEFKFKMLTPSDFPALFDHIRDNFLVDEPLLKSIFGAETGQSIDPNAWLDEEAVADALEFGGMVRDRLEENMSFAAYHRETGKMAGVRIINRRIQGDDCLGAPGAGSFRSTRAKILVQFIQKIDASADMFKLYGIDQYAELFMASVDKEFRRSGLAIEMHRRATTFLASGGQFTVARGIYTSPYTRAVAGKFKFEELSRCYVRDMVDLSGRSIWPEAGDDQFVTVMALRLSNFSARL